MTLRLCLLGNSHAACLRQALDAAPPPGIEATVFASHRDSLRHVRIEDGRVLPGHPGVRENFRWTSGGQEAIALGEFDALVVVAGPSLFALHPFAAGPDLAPIGEGCLDACLDARAEAWDVDLGARIAAAAPGLDVIHLGEPLPSENWPRARAILAAPALSGLRATVRLARLRGRVARGAAERAEARGFRALPPPGETHEPRGLFTRHTYCRGSARLTPGLGDAHPEGDFVHMNASYGARVLAHLVEHVAPARAAA